MKIRFLNGSELSGTFIASIIAGVIMIVASVIITETKAEIPIEYSYVGNLVDTNHWLDYEDELVLYVEVNDTLDARTRNDHVIHRYLNKTEQDSFYVDGDNNLSSR